MSIIVEIGGFLGGVLSEYAAKKNWSKLKTFIIVSFSFFAVGAIYVIIFPSAKDKWLGVLVFAAIGVIMGIITVLLIFLGRWYKDKKLSSHE